MIEHVAPVVFALLLWWGSTGAIIYADGLPSRTFSWTFLFASAFLVLALAAVIETRADTSTHGAYIAFSSGLMIWAWVELAFYLGYLTGPRKTACPAGCRGLRHFWHAVETVLWNQLASIAVLIVLIGLTWQAPNKLALWVFVVLWLMQQSAKLNVYFGVRNLNEHFLPDHLAHLKAFMSRRPMNSFFPISVSLATVAFVLIVDRAHAAELTDGQSVGLGLLATLLALAILEHWFLILPIPAERLWDWSLASRNKSAYADETSKRESTEAEWTTLFDGPCDRHALREVLEGVARGNFGEIDKLEGTAVADHGWVTFDVADGDARITSVVPGNAPLAEARVFGRELDHQRLQAALAGCVRNE